MMPKTTKRVALALAAFLPGFANAAAVNVVAQFTTLFGVVLAVSSFIGVMLFAQGLYSIYVSSSGRSNKSVGQGLMNMLVGTFMLSVGWVYGMMKASFIGNTATGVDYEGREALALNGVEAAAIAAGNAVSKTAYGKFIDSNTLQAVFAFVFFVGLLAFVHGVYLLRTIGMDGGDANMKRAAFYRIFGGLICMNITWFSCLVGGILGISSMCFGE